MVWKEHKRTNDPSYSLDKLLPRVVKLNNLLKSEKSIDYHHTKNEFDVVNHLLKEQVDKMSLPKRVDFLKNHLIYLFGEYIDNYSFFKYHRADERECNKLQDDINLLADQIAYFRDKFVIISTGDRNGK